MKLMLKKKKLSYRCDMSTFVCLNEFIYWVDRSFKDPLDGVQGTYCSRMEFYNMVLVLVMFFHVFKWKLLV